MSVRTRILQGIGANAFGQVANIIIQVLTLPIFLSAWGTRVYGEWLLLSSLAAFLSMSDVGFGTAAANEMTMRNNRGDRAGALVVFQSIWTLLCVLGGVVLGLTLVLLWLAPVAHWFKLEETSGTAAKAVLAIMAMTILLGQLSSVVQSGFRCEGLYAKGQVLGTLGRLAEFFAQAGVVLWSGSMTAVALAGLAARAVATVASFAVLRRSSPWLKLGCGSASFDEVRRLAAPAMAFLGMPLGHALGNQGVIQVIAATLSPAAVTAFAAHRTLANFSLQFSNLLANSIWPELSIAMGSANRELAQKIHRTACRWTLWVGLLATGGLAVAGPFIIPFWTHGKIECLYALLIILLADVLLRMCWWTSSAVPLASNDHASMTVAYVVLNCGALALAWALSLRLGVEGAAIAVSALDVAMILVVVPATLRSLDDTLAAFLRSVMIPPLTLPRRSLLP
jgi:O-antigen/teichoic acid export membrane protein